MIKFRCFRCTRRLHTSNQNAGKMVRCPSCKELAHVPSTAEEIEAALAAADQQGDEGSMLPQGQRTEGHMGVHRRSVKPHRYGWFRLIAGVYFGLGVVLSLVGGVWFVWQVWASVSNGVGHRADVFEHCLWLMGGMIAALTFFAASQIMFAFRDMVENSWASREMTLLLRSLACSPR